MKNNNSKMRRNPHLPSFNEKFIKIYFSAESVSLNSANSIYVKVFFEHSLVFRIGLVNKGSLFFSISFHGGIIYEATFQSA